MQQMRRERALMFKRITIQMTEPICSCEEQKINWTPKLVQVVKGGKTFNSYTLDLWCETCETRLSVSNEKFRASFEFDKPYPGKKVVEEKDKPKPKAKFEVLEGGAKVIPFVSPSGFQASKDNGESP